MVDDENTSRGPNTGGSAVVQRPNVDQLSAAAIARPRPIPPPNLNSPVPPLPTAYIARPMATIARPDTASASETTPSQSAASAATGLVDIPRPTPSATFNGRTYSGAELDKLASSANTIPSENFTRPGIGTLGVPMATDDGLRIAAMDIPRPTAQATQDDVIRRPMIERPGSYDPASAASRYSSDMAAIVDKDPRSLSGTAAHNADADAIWARNTARTPSERRQAAADYQQTKAALLGSAQGIFDAQNQAGIANARDQTAWADNANTNAANVARAGLLADSRLGSAAERAYASGYSADTRSDAMRYAADARGNAQRDVATINVNRPRTNAAFEHGSAMAYANGYTQALQSGLSPDQAIDYAQRNRAAFEQRNAPQDQQGQAAAAQIGDPRNPPLSTSSQESQSGRAAPAPPGPSAASIQYLQQNPHFADQFDAKYGKGAAAQYLRNR